MEQPNPPMSHYPIDTIDKIGNAIIYITSKTSAISKTKILKLLYLLEENSAIMFKTPFFGIKFETWEMGPVAKDVFNDLSDGPKFLSMLGDYLIECETFYGKAFRGKVDFNDDEFSDNDIEVMDYIIQEHGYKSAEKLIKELHKKGSAWDITAQNNGLHELFKSGVKTSETPVDVSVSLSEEARERYTQTAQIWEAMRAFKR